MATISVSSTATDASYDIQVMNTNGSSGKGTELFGVNSTATGKPTYPVFDATTTVSNSDFGGSPLVFQSDNVAGPSAVYCATSTIGPACTASAFIASFVGGAPGEFELDLTQQNTRVVYLDFALLTPNNGSPVFPVSSGYYNSIIFNRCYDSGSNLMSLLNIPAATSNNNCSMRVNFSAGGQSYSFVMAPTKILPSGAPATGRATVACNSWASDGSGCNNWTITPYALGVNGTSADLVRLAVNGKNVVVGSYSGDTFRIDVRR